ncbi:MAG: hypothetical protein H7A23_23300 [Leptospiraceae bacterium]|nr:hypothetical protein [Leptospiraceae bacterium]MCP5497494.1 hypothetical protein [Leptospiraceae bacterium]
MKKKKVLKLKKWTENIKNSNEKKVIKCIKKLLPEYNQIKWNEKNFISLYMDSLNSLPSRYKQKNSIEISGRMKEEVILDAVKEKLDEIVENMLLEEAKKNDE